MDRAATVWLASEDGGTWAGWVYSPTHLVASQPSASTQLMYVPALYHVAVLTTRGYSTLKQ